MYNYICIYITHNTYNIYIIIYYPYMGYIKRQKRFKILREQLNQKKSGWTFPPLLPAFFTLWLVKVPPPLWETNGGKALILNPVIYFWLGGGHLVGPWSPTWMFRIIPLLRNTCAPSPKEQTENMARKNCFFSKYIGHTYMYIYPNVQGQNGMNSYPKKSTKNHLMGFFFIAFRWGRAARCILFLIQSNRWLC